jgi:hypothetical protein
VLSLGWQGYGALPHRAQGVAGAQEQGRDFGELAGLVGVVVRVVFEVDGELLGALLRVAFELDGGLRLAVVAELARLG